MGVLGVALLAVGLYALFGGSPPAVGDIAVQFGLPAEPAYLFVAFSPIVFLMGAGWSGLAIGLMYL